ncbi:MAG: hypothetical protein J6Q20_05540 [Alistipes sp.]|nr:hypothetical protein [Alistipes sp.]
MKKVLMLAIALLVCGGASAQKIEDFKARLAEPTLNDSLGMTGRVEVREVGTAADAVRKIDAAQSPTTVKGFRIVIFFDNGSSARANAEAAILSFNALYPDVRSYMDYENPYFKVLVGGCVTSEEAIVLLGRITPNFPKAYITREEIKLSELAQPKFVAEPAEAVEN